MGRIKLVGIEEAAKVFGLNVSRMRTYKDLGIIDPISKKGNKDLYYLRELIFAKKILDKTRLKENIKRIGEIVSEERIAFRKKFNLDKYL